MFVMLDILYTRRSVVRLNSWSEKMRVSSHYWGQSYLQAICAFTLTEPELSELRYHLSLSFFLFLYVSFLLTQFIIYIYRYVKTVKTLICLLNYPLFHKHIILLHCFYLFSFLCIHFCLTVCFYRHVECIAWCDLSWMLIWNMKRLGCTVRLVKDAFCTLLPKARETLSMCKGNKISHLRN